MVVGYKGIRKDMTTPCGGRRKKLKVGVWMEEKKADVARSGFHFSDNPMVALGFYGNPETDTWFVVLADGDIDEAADGRLTCTRIKLAKELTLTEMVFAAMDYTVEHPEAKGGLWGGSIITSESSWEDGAFSIVRGKSPMARGKIGQIIGLMEEEIDSESIRSATIFTIDGREYLPNTWYSLRKGKVHKLDEREDAKEDSVDGETNKEGE